MSRAGESKLPSPNKTQSIKKGSNWDGILLIVLVILILAMGYYAN